MVDYFKLTTNRHASLKEEYLRQSSCPEGDYPEVLSVLDIDDDTVLVLCSSSKRHWWYYVSKKELGYWG